MRKFFHPTHVLTKNSTAHQRDLERGREFFLENCLYRSWAYNLITRINMEDDHLCHSSDQINFFREKMSPNEFDPLPHMCRLFFPKRYQPSCIVGFRTILIEEAFDPSIASFDCLMSSVLTALATESSFATISTKTPRD